MDAVLLAWNDVLATGIAEIDDQHRELFRCVDRVRDATAAGDGSELDRTLAFLQDYVEFHFRAEERYMASQRFPGMARHVEEHAALLEAVRAIVADHHRQRGAAGALERVEHFLSDWMRTHIAVTDVALARFVRRARPG